jgi:hypothetical protein
MFTTGCGYFVPLRTYQQVKARLGEKAPPT